MDIKKDNQEVDRTLLSQVIPVYLLTQTTLEHAQRVMILVSVAGLLGYDVLLRRITLILCALVAVFGMFFAKIVKMPKNIEFCEKFVL